MNLVLRYPRNAPAALSFDGVMLMARQLHLSALDDSARDDGSAGSQDAGSQDEEEQ